MTSPYLSSLAVLNQGAVISPFTRLRRLLGDAPPGHEKPIEMTIGEPREEMPHFVLDKMREAQASLAKYPLIRGSEELRQSIAQWIERRYGVGALIDPGRGILPVNGSREGLVFAVFPAVGRKAFPGKPAVLMPNPYYVAYLGAAIAAGAEPVFLNATAETGHLPDLARLESDTELLQRTAAFFLCSPANPQGAVADATYLERALLLARRYNFMLFVDECYSEIYTREPPIGALQVAAGMAQGTLDNLVVFNSLSKRSNLPGLRSGFCAGDPAFMETLAEIRNMIGPQMPGPIQHASAAVWAEEQHVAAIRQAYRVKFDIADAVLGRRFGYRRPGGGFLLWLEMSHLGGGLAATVTLWKRCGVKVIPGAYLAEPGVDGRNPGDAYVRVALVHDPATIREALERIVSVSA
jgi:aspartate/methionine/tyrosine aminotransferase